MSLNMNAIRPLVERYKTATAGWQMQLALAVAEQSPALLAKVDELTAELIDEQASHQATLRNQSALSAEVVRLRAVLAKGGAL